MCRTTVYVNISCFSLAKLYQLIPETHASNKTSYNSPTCPHAWLELDESCRIACAADEENDLLTCPMFQDKAVISTEMLLTPRQATAALDDCPQCDYDEYDIREYRMCTAKDHLRNRSYGRKDWNCKGRGAKPIGASPKTVDAGGKAGWADWWLNSPQPPPPAYMPPQHRMVGNGVIVEEKWTFVPSPSPKPKKHNKMVMRENDVDYICCAVM